MPDDPEPNAATDFSARSAQHRAQADTYRMRALAPDDELLRKVYAGLAFTYDNMARAIEQTALRIESIRLATQRARQQRRDNKDRDVAD